jgi:hypothetical protein
MKKRILLGIALVSALSAIVIYAACDDKVRNVGTERVANNTSCTNAGTAKVCSYEIYDTPYQACDGTTGLDPKSNKVCTQEAAPGSNHATHTVTGHCDGTGGCTAGALPGVAGPTYSGQAGFLSSC